MPEERKRYFRMSPLIEFQWFYIHRGQISLLLHLTMFTHSMKAFCNEEQLKKWMPKIENCDIFGSYAQTEIGHGSDIQNLKTTATYDKEKQEFVLHTPSLDATKWWPGGLGSTVNHALVVARIVIPEDDGEVNDYGVGMFIVQIRDQDTHEHMPGIKTGQLGPKFGFSSADNGWMTMDHVRIKKDDMLSRFNYIDEDGCYSVNGDPRILFGTMIKTRILIFSGAYLAQLFVCLTSIRYSIVRRQFKNKEGDEIQLIDY